MTTLIPQYDLKNGNATPTGAVNRPINQKLGETVSVKDFGAVGDGVTDDSDAIQAALNYIANNQFPTSGFPQWTYNIAGIYFPQGTYIISRQMEVRSIIVIQGIGGVGYVAGSTIRQTTPDTNIFTFYSSGSEVFGMNFEFQSQSGSKFGYALAYNVTNNNPPPSTISSNSHYIHNNRCGGYYRYGRFAYFQGGGDFSICENVVDVCFPGEAVTIGSQNNSYGTGSIRIVGNNFFGCEYSIAIYKATSVTIVGNEFSYQFIGTGAAIQLVSDAASPVANSIQGITITGNTFLTQATCLKIDSSASNIIYSDNVHSQSYAPPINVVGTTNVSQLKVHNNYIKVLIAGEDPDFNFNYSFENCPFALGQAKLINSEVCDNTVDANGLNSIFRFFASNVNTYALGDGMVIRNNKIINNNTYPGVYATHVPMSANELVVTNSQTFSAYPVNQQILTFNVEGISLGSSATFYLDYSVTSSNTSSNSGTAIGTVKVSFARLSSPTTATKFNITSIANIADDSSGAGTYNPTVTFSGFSTTTASGLLISVTDAMTGTVTTIVKIKAYGFTSIGTAQIQS